MIKDERHEYEYQGNVITLNSDVHCYQDVAYSDYLCCPSSPLIGRLDLRNFSVA